MAQVEQIITNRYLVVEKLRDLLTARFGTDYNVTVRTLSQPFPSFRRCYRQPCENQVKSGAQAVACPARRLCNWIRISKAGNISSLC
ncbi:hypothetical protein BJX66DRAFT_316866 [Aspergillus keveii]|uniref:Uncharacterized protein n=1 Tax=Aspergillus keveii TaxID=714993 RepID=A0ABR4FM24_9EURO